MPSLFDVLIAHFPVEGGYRPGYMPFQVGDHGKGNGPEIVAWDEKALGPKPTATELEKLTADYVPPAPPTKEERLAALLKREGLTVADLRAVLR
jgi:hypothetical protein